MENQPANIAYDKLIIALGGNIIHKMTIEILKLKMKHLEFLESTNMFIFLNLLEMLGKFVIEFCNFLSERHYRLYLNQSAR